MIENLLPLKATGDINVAMATRIVAL
jgi:hypothetical protein